MVWVNFGEDILGEDRIGEKVFWNILSPNMIYLDMF